MLNYLFPVILIFNDNTIKYHWITFSLKDILNDQCRQPSSLSSFADDMKTYATILSIEDMNSLQSDIQRKQKTDKSVLPIK